ncbi:TetR/AcrR family transcriptional regulator [Bacillus sp. Marseille-P3661]|uniref:TetR/AcrR family transcriptional regulator n=1 Tax=Bacillus sp. Marseille-P3661 TaxID=1936234 RepID=UPI000C832B1A|nr:TetR/AcrR family transcriptional regulator [Bacillus sp. Marseille-P3661]
MNDRKQHVIQMAHQLFIEKGFQATSIQDILNYSGISKGTFYNYFSSKNELLIGIFKSIYSKLEKERNELLKGQDRSSIDIFTKQVELYLITNRSNKLLSLFEEVMSSKDEDLKQFIRKGQLRVLRWVYHRFIDIFGETKKAYLLDCTIMFLGILQHNLKYNALAFPSEENINKIVRYSMNRIMNIVTEVSVTNEQLLHPNLLDRWLPNCKDRGDSLQSKLALCLIAIKKQAQELDDRDKNMELINFIEEELLHSKTPRRFVIEGAILALKDEQKFKDGEDLQKLELLIKDYFIKSSGSH